MSELGKVIEELERLEKAATPGPWRAGRMDAESYDGNGVGPYKNVYADDPRGGVHRPTGETLPYTVARGEGDECLVNAAIIALLRTHAPTLIAAAKRAEQAERERGEEAAAHSRTVDERESAVDAITRAYTLVVGESPTWSNRFGYAEALGDIENAFHALQRAARQSTSADSLKAENMALIRTCEMMFRRNDLLEEEVGRLRGRITEFTEAVDNYKLAHDLNGDGSPEAGRAWFNMTSARNRAVMGSMIQPPTANEGATTLEGAGGEVRAEGGEA